MKELFLSLIILLSINSKAQKIEVKPDMVVSRTDFNITVMEGNGRELQTDKANMIIDEISKDNLDVYILIRGFAIWGLHINISKDSIKPEYYHWDDGGGYEKHLKFDSYDLRLNASNYKIGERLVGKFSGIVTETLKDGKIEKHKLKGKFSHVINNTREYLKRTRDEEKTDLSRKIYRNTGIYYRMTLEDGLAIKSPTYLLNNTDDEYYLYSSPKDLVIGLENFSRASAEFDSKKKGMINIKLKLIDQKTENYSELTKTYIKYGLVIDDKLWNVGDGLKYQNEYVIFPLKVKKEKANELVGRLNFAIQKAKDDKKRMLYTTKHPN